MIVDRENSNRDSSTISSRIFSEGNAGDIEITTNSLDVTNGGLISTDISGRGEGGDISISATESVIVDGEKINGDSSTISSRIFSEGNAGNLEITTNSLDVTNGGLISTDTFGRGDGGNISITATESVIVEGEKKIALLVKYQAMYF
ncbi:hypothetical protein H1P_3220003 [Hyella patelloides LEGE 07179]|uniref:Uncharacterized protein n=1 Tax=Hyella patelloides LEGE 07179 TaxID=945734 RepID=A0A563VV72_9CYAN|nr:hypothetical protein H1P_3220003 [Hyella patelloides LEGE 07179]